MISTYGRDKHTKLRVKLPWKVDHTGASCLPFVPHHWKGIVDFPGLEDGKVMTANAWAKWLLLEWGEFRKLLDEHPSWFERV